MTSGWAESPLLRVEYLDELQSIDMAIAELLAKRERVAKGKWFIPPKEVVTQWATQFDIHSDLLFWLFRTLTRRPQANVPIGLDELEQIIPLMKRKLMGECVYTLTHVEQYASCSLVHLTVKLDDASASYVSQLQLSLVLDVGPGEYSVRNYGGQGGGTSLSARYLVTPKLPDDVNSLRFSLVPSRETPLSPPHVVHELTDPVAFS